MFDQPEDVLPVEDVDFGGSSLFGYDSLVRRPEFIELKGKTAKSLNKGMVVEISGDSRGYVPSGHEPGEKVTIIGFREPFKRGESDHIIQVTNGEKVGWVKPSNITIP
jgi:hypothetical protein